MAFPATKLGGALLPRLRGENLYFPHTPFGSTQMSIAFYMPLTGVEPVPLAPEANALSIALQGHFDYAQCPYPELVEGQGH